MGKVDIFYIDSQKEYSKKLLSFLIENGYNIKYINNIKDTFIEYSYNKPHLIISDFTLEDGNGLNLIKKIKQQNDSIKTIILTSNKDPEMFMEAISIKIDTLLSKDSSFNEIAQEIDKLNTKQTDTIEDSSPILFNIGNSFYYEKNSHRIIKDNQIIQLTLQQNTLIDELIKVQGSFLASHILQNAIGSSSIATIDTLRTVIRKIRKKTYPDIIQNQSKIGYKINFQNDIDIKSKFKIEDDIKFDLKILIVKGTKHKSDQLRFQLEGLGFSCENVYTIDDAKTILEIEHFDYIISELSLPDGDGIDFIRDIEDNKESKIIILSSSTDIHYKEYLYFKGILDYIINIDDISYLAYNIYKTILKVETNTEFNNILVVEQSKRICEQIKDLLQPRNYVVNVINDLVQAYELLKTTKYSMVILDISYKNSFDFLVDIKSNIDKSIPFIVLTDTNRTYEIVRDAYKNGASECLRKPIFAEEFILKVDQLIEHSKLIGELNIQKDLLESYKEVVDKSAIISKTDTKGIITYVNSMFCNISGYSKEELIGQPHNIVRAPETTKETFKEMWYTIKKRKKIWHGMLKNIKKDGSEYYVQTSIMPILDKDNNIKEFIALRNNITDIYKEQK